MNLLVVVDRILWICNDTWPHLEFDKWVLSQAVWHLKVKNRSPRLNNFQLLTFCPSAKVLSCFTKSKVYNDTKLVAKNPGLILYVHCTIWIIYKLANSWICRIAYRLLKIAEFGQNFQSQIKNPESEFLPFAFVYQITQLVSLYTF